MAPVTCPKCGADTPLRDLTNCPDCGRRVARVCFCGERLPLEVEQCPRCATDWGKVEGYLESARREHQDFVRGLWRARILSLLAWAALAVVVVAAFWYTALR